jgi:Fur family ferric uptake transcriptional regulator
MGPAGGKREGRLHELLRGHRLRVTDQRLRVLRELARLRMPVSHTELADRLAGEDMDRATVFRNLVSLADAGILARSQLGAVWRYELPGAEGTAHAKHPHFVCTDCGDVACLPEKAIQVRKLPARSVVAEIQVRGRCSSCATA